MLDSCRKLESEGYKVTYLPVQKSGLIDLEVRSLRNLESQDTKNNCGKHLLHSLPVFALSTQIPLPFLFLIFDITIFLFLFLFPLFLFFFLRSSSRRSRPRRRSSRS